MRAGLPSAAGQSAPTTHPRRVVGIDVIGLGRRLVLVLTPVAHGASSGGVAAATVAISSCASRRVRLACGWCAVLVAGVLDGGPRLVDGDGEVLVGVVDHGDKRDHADHHVAVLLDAQNGPFGPVDGEHDRDTPRARCRPPRPQGHVLRETGMMDPVQNRQLVDIGVS
ncbi:DUF4913 domain-containing protein [Cellulosimicrobium cellulans]|uniref:DUF4913 domain-containing protein n=1 Tax=Cellulosimicrobium cellulans TaxID=1710 RepID=UPI002149C32F|nr:DUF4913 domain-containing protein [Cellulosimicrobium cellulans]